MVNGVVDVKQLGGEVRDEHGRTGVGFEAGDDSCARPIQNAASARQSAHAAVA